MIIKKIFNYFQNCAEDDWLKKVDPGGAGDFGSSTDLKNKNETNY